VRDLVSKKLRGRQDATRSDVLRVPPPPPSVPLPKVCRTVAMPGEAYPSGIGKLYGVQPLAESGEASEGEAVVYENRSAPFLATHVGATQPPVSTLVLVVYAVGVGYIFEY
jgi:hypothetical protein